MPFLFSGRSRDRRRRWTLALGYAALLASCDSPFAPDVQEVERLDVTPPVLTLVVGGNATLTAKVYGPDDNLLPAAKVFWSTQDPTVVTVDQNGIVSGVAAGTAQIAASSGGQSRTIAVTVSQKPIALVRITPPATTIAAGQAFQLHGEALDGNGALLPNRLLEWATNAPNIATVDNTGLVSGVAVGQATISATGEGKVGTSVITVQPTPVSTITVTPNGGSLPAGSTMTFTATPRDANGNPLTGRNLQWRSSNDAVATISAAGLLTAISPGQVTITVSAPNGGPGGSTPSTSVIVTVLIEPVASAVLVPNPASVQVGKTLNLTVNLLDSGGEPLSTAGRNIVWSTSNAAIATVNSSGVVTGVATGTATITATITTPGQAGTVQATTQLTVSNQPVASVVVTPSSATVHVGYGRPFTAVARDAQGQSLTGRAIVWTSSNQGIATVDGVTGLVAGVSQGSVQIRATSEGVQGSADVVVDLVPVSSVVVTPAAPSLLPTQTVQLSAVPRDSAGNTIQGPALGARPTTWASGNTLAATVNATGLVTAVAQGMANVTATIGGTPGQSVVTVSALPSASQLAITTQPSASAPNNAPFPVQPVVQLKDVNGNNVSTPGIAITAAITAPGTGTLGGTVTATTNASGAATFTDLKITGTVGVRTLTFSSGALAPATSSGVNITPGTATQLSLVTPPPATANSGQAFSSASVVQLQDTSGNNVTQLGVPVTADVSPSAGVTLSGRSTTTNASGTATFGALTLTGSAGVYTLTFSSGTLATVTSGTITLSAGGGSKLAVIQQPASTAQSGAVFSPQPQVQLQDGSGNPVALAGVQVSANIQSGAPTLNGTAVTTNPSGIATFTNLSISGTVGSRTLLFGAVGYTSVESGVINITAGPPAALVIATPPSSTAQSGAAFGTQPAIQVRDASGNPVLQAGIVITATLVGSGGSLLPGTNTATTDGTGLATFSGLGITGTAGSGYSLTFSSGSLPPISSGPITLTSGAATQLTITTEPGGGASGAALSPQPVVQVRDAQGNPVLTAGTTVTAGVASGPGATVTGGSVSTNGSGQAVFSGLTLTGTAGSYTISFTSGSLTGATSGAITLTHGAAAQLTIQTQPAGAASGAAFTTQPVILVRDAQNNPVPGITASATPSAGATLVGSGNSLASDAAGLATFSGLGLSGLVGNYTIDFSVSGAPNVTSGTIALAAGAAAQLSMASQPASSVANGGALSSSVQVRDAAGNPVSDNGTPVTVALIGSGATLGGTTTVNTASGVATFNAFTITGLVGNYSLSFSASGLSGTSSNQFALTAGAATKLVMFAQPSPTAVSGSPFGSQPAVRLRDASDNDVAQSGVDVTATPSGGSLVGSNTATTDGSGVATFSGLGISGSTGAYTITFSSGSLTSATSVDDQRDAPADTAGDHRAASRQRSTAARSVPSPSSSADVDNTPVNQSGVLVSATLSSGSGTLGGTTSATHASGGVASFGGLVITGTVGSYTLTFSAEWPDRCRFRQHQPDVRRRGAARDHHATRRDRHERRSILAAANRPGPRCTGERRPAGWHDNRRGDTDRPTGGDHPGQQCDNGCQRPGAIHVTRSHWPGWLVYDHLLLNWRERHGYF